MRKMKWATILVVIIIQSCQQKETITSEEVIAAIQRFDEGWKNKNAVAVDSLLSPSYVYFTQSGGTFNRNNVVHTAGSSDYKLDSLLRQRIDIKVEGNTAIVNTVWYGRGSYFNNPFDDRQRCSITLIKENGRVVILSEHCTLIR